MQDTSATIAVPPRSASRRRHLGMAAVTAVLVAGAAAACSRPTTPPPPPTTGPCRAIDFQRAEVRAVASNGTTTAYELRVSGEKPSMSQTVKLVPVTYIRQPEYWRIEVQACDPPEAGLPATGRYEVTLPLSGSLGTKGIEVAGATRTQRIDVPSRPEPGPSVVGSWHVTGITGGITGAIVPVNENSPISLEFRADGKLSGRACNSYSAGWTVDGRSIAVTDLVSTRMACPGPGVGEQENRYFSALRAATSWRIERNQLTLTDANGRDVVTAQRGAPRAPEPTTTTTNTRSRPSTSTSRTSTTAAPATTTTTTTAGHDHGGHGGGDHDRTDAPA